jgi:hypothetical protein
MTSIERAIKEAVEKGDYDDSRIELGIQCEDAYDHYLLDPLFWQALGKARRWPMKWPQPYQTRDGIFLEITWWEYKWHEFVHHLAGGKDAEGFFVTI